MVEVAAAPDVVSEVRTGVPGLAVAGVAVTLLLAGSRAGAVAGVAAALIGGALALALIIHRFTGATVVAALPAGLICLVAMLVLAWQAGVAPASGRTWSGVLWWASLGALGAAAIGAARGRRMHLAEPREVPAGVAAAVLLGLGALVVLATPFAVWGRNFFLGTDFARHAEMAARMADGSGAQRIDKYPRALHVAISWAGHSVGPDWSLTQAWQATAATTWVIATAMLLGLGLIAGRWVGVHASPQQPRRVVAWAAVALAATVFIQTVWLGRMMSEGYVVNFLVGLCLVVTAWGLGHPGWGTAAGLGVASAALVVTVNTWLLLAPAVAVGLAGAAARAQRDRRWWLAAGILAVLSGAACVAVAWPYVQQAITHVVPEGSATPGQAITAFTPTGLREPFHWWGWAGLVGLALLGVSWRRDRGYVSWYTAMIVVAGAVFAWMHLSSGVGWSEIRYYPVKYLWTEMLLGIPLFAAALPLAVAAAWGRAGRAELPVAARTAVAGLCLTGLAFWLAWESANPFRPWEVLSGRLGTHMLHVAMVEQLDARFPSPTGREAIVFGLAPDTRVVSVLGLGPIDGIAQESLTWTNLGAAVGESVKPAVMVRDSTAVCGWLQRHPDVLVVTGPNPAAGAGWLADAGCPEVALRRERWVAVELDPAWTTGVTLDPPNQMPSAAELEAMLHGEQQLSG